MRSPPAPLRGSAFSSPGLAVADLDIGRVLADHDGVTFRVQGTCMYPAMRPGDVLRIRSCGAADVTFGDVAVCRRSQYLFSHRVIATGRSDGRGYVVTRADRAGAGSDTPTFDDDFLGVVVSLERGGVRVPLERVEYPWLACRYHRLRLALIELTPRLNWWLTHAAALVQESGIYGRLARRWCARTRRRVQVSVRVPLNATLGDSVSRVFEAAEFDPGAMCNGRPVDRWTLVAQIDDARDPAAWATFARSDTGAWRTDASHIRVRYRGTGLGEALLRRAEEIVARSAERLEKPSR